MESVQATWFRALGTTAGVHATEPGILDEAVDTAQQWLERLDRAASRFRVDSELQAINTCSAREPVTVSLSPLLGEVLDAALLTAALTGGLVDPTIGAALLHAGYNDDLAVVQNRTGWTMVGEPEPAPGWRQISYTPETKVLAIPAGTLLDFGSSAKAYAADRIAGLLAGTLPGGFLIDLGGDIAVAGSAPAGGWQVGIEDEGRRIGQVITLFNQALATSSTRHRAWASGFGTAHHIIDPQTGAPAERIWAQVTCLGATALEANAASTAAVIMGLEAPAERIWAQVTCLGATALEANAASTAAVIMGLEAPTWLRAHGIDARLHGMDGSTVITGNWPSDHHVSGAR